MLHDWGVIAAAFGYIGFLFLVASYGDRLSPTQRGHASGLIYPLSLAIYCTSWTFFGSVGFATRTSVDFLAIYIGPILMIGLCTPLLRRVIQLAKSQNITSIADFIAARYGKSQAVAATVALIAIIGSVPYIALQLKAVASSLETILSEDQAFSSHSDHRRHRADRDAGDGGLRGAVRHPPDRRHRTPAWPDAGGRHRIHHQAGGLPRRRRLRHVLDVQPARTDRTRDEDAGGGARHRLHALDRQLPHHGAAVVLRHHAAAAPVPRQRGGELHRCRGRPRALAVSVLSGRHQSVRDSDRARGSHHLSVRRGRQRHVRAGVADGGKCAAAQRRRLRRRPVGGNRDGDRGMRRAFGHGVERHHGSAGAAARSAIGGAARRISAISCSRLAAFRFSASWRWRISITARSATPSSRRSACCRSPPSRSWRRRFSAACSGGARPRAAPSAACWSAARCGPTRCFCRASWTAIPRAC